MRLKDYKIKKAKLALEQEKEESTWRVKCHVCFRPKNNCLCHHVKEFETRTKIVILMHTKEAKKEKLGTGRISAACLSNSQVITGIDFTQNSEVNALINSDEYHAMVLYPGNNAFNVSNDKIENLPLPKNKKLLIFVIDGTWPCAKKMMRLSKNIHGLPRICFTPNKKSEFHIKEQPDAYCLSTIESLHLLLDEMNQKGMETLEKQHENLLEVFREMVKFQVKCAENPNLKSYRSRKGRYTKPEERRRSKKWNSRKIIFD
jgi:DTW domain-containing protein YfiP